MPPVDPDISQPHPPDDGSPFVAVHVERSGTFLVDAPPDRVFALLTPEGERLWVPGWEPEWLHHGQGADRKDGVFRTRVHGERTVWMVLACDPSTRRARYLRLTPDSRVGVVDVACADRDAGGTEAGVAYRLTALSEEGNDTLRAFTEAAFREMLDEWRGAITAALGVSGAAP